MLKQLTRNLIIVRDLYSDERCYALRLEGSRAAVEDVTSPTDEQVVLGFGTWAKTDAGRVFAGYFADDRPSPEEAPSYEKGFNLIVGDRIFAMSDASIRVRLKEGLGRRSFEIVDMTTPPVVVTYLSVPLKEAAGRLVGDPFGYKSSDIFYEIREMVRSYAPSALL
jgi:hypothetical protein